MILNKNNKLKKEDNDKKEIIKEIIISQSTIEINENKNIPIIKNKKKKTFQKFEDN